MTNEQLRTFIAVVEQGSFRAAATSLFKTQPSVSASVKALEDKFTISLFDRSSYRPVLTPEGKAFYQQSKQLIKQTSELEMFGHQLAAGEIPALTLSMSAMCTSPPGLNIIKQFCKNHPEMRLNINTQHLSGVLEQLLLEKSDLAIGPHTGLDDRYEYVEISQIKMITVTAPDYLPVKPNEEVSHKVLRSLPHILISDSGSVAPFDHVNVLTGGQRWYVNDYQMKKALLLAGMGWARIPAHIVEYELDNGCLVQHQVENFNSQNLVPIYLIRLKNQAVSHLAKAFWEEMLQPESS